MVQSGKFLPCKHANLNAIPRIYVKKKKSGHSSSLVTLTLEVETRSWKTCLAKVSERPCVKIQCGPSSSLPFEVRGTPIFQPTIWGLRVHREGPVSLWFSCEVREPVQNPVLHPVSIHQSFPSIALPIHNTQGQHSKPPGSLAAHVWFCFFHPLYVIANRLRLTSPKEHKLPSSQPLHWAWEIRLLYIIWVHLYSSLFSIPLSKFIHFFPLTLPLLLLCIPLL